MSKKINARLARITPSLASKLLKQNSRNRHVSQALVSKYERDMSRGDWTLNGEPIIVGASGVLLDGQHRLHAVVESGVTVEILLVEGVDDSAFSTIDSGAARTFAHVLGIEGEKNCTDLAGALRLLWYYRSGYVTGEAGRGMQGANSPTHKELLALYEREPGVNGSVEFARRSTWRKLLSPAMAAFCHYVFSEAYPDRADEFMDSLRTGEFPRRGKAPARLLRDRLIDNLGSAEKLGRASVLYLVFRAFKAYAEGERMQRLILPKGQKHPYAPLLS